MTFASTTLASTVLAGALASSAAEANTGGGNIFGLQVMFAEGVATITPVRAAFRLTQVTPVGGMGARVMVPSATMRVGVSEVQARGITNPSREELEALLLSFRGLKSPTHSRVQNHPPPEAWCS